MNSNPVLHGNHEIIDEHLDHWDGYVSSLLDPLFHVVYAVKSYPI